MDVAPDWSQRKYWDFFIMPEVSALLPKDSIKDRLVMPIKSFGGHPRSVDS